MNMSEKNDNIDHICSGVNGEKTPVKHSADGGLPGGRCPNACEMTKGGRYEKE